VDVVDVADKTGFFLSAEIRRIRGLSFPVEYLVIARWLVIIVSRDESLIAIGQVC
jgi:hypothetical protein